MRLEVDMCSRCDVSLLPPPQDNNAVVKTWGTPREEPELVNHVDLVQKLGIADLEKGTAVAGAPI